jgi:hypothetical protein
VSRNGWSLLSIVVAVTACGRLFGLTGDDDLPSGPSVTPDAGGDTAATATGEAGPLDAGPCGDPNAVFCANFDERPQGSFTEGAFVEMGNTIAIVGEGRSMPNAVAALGSGAGHALHFFPVVDPAPPRLSLELWTKVVSDEAPVIFIQLIWSLAGDVRHGVKAQLSSDLTQLEEFHGPVGVGYLGPTNSGAQNLSGGSWHRVVIDVDWSGKTAKLRYDNAVLTLALQRDFEGGSGHVDFGALGFGDGTGAERKVLFDDVVVRAP